MDLLTSSGSFSYSFSSSVSVQINSVAGDGGPFEGDFIFVPAKEVLSFVNVTLKSRDIDWSFGFDDTYYELAKLLNITSGSSMADEYAREGEILGGKVEFDAKSQRWVYRKGNQKFSINMTAEGIKKMGVLSRLLSNGCLNTNSILLI